MTDERDTQYLFEAVERARREENDAAYVEAFREMKAGLPPEAAALYPNEEDLILPSEYTAIPQVNSLVDYVELKTELETLRECYAVARLLIGALAIDYGQRTGDEEYEIFVSGAAFDAQPACVDLGFSDAIRDGRRGRIMVVQPHECEIEPN